MPETKKAGEEEVDVNRDRENRRQAGAGESRDFRYSRQTSVQPSIPEEEQMSADAEGTHASEHLLKDEEGKKTEGLEDMGEKRTGEEEEEDDDEGLPVDRGWSWVIMACCFLDYAIIFGHNRALSALFVDITETFDQSTTVGTLMFTVYTLCCSVSSVLTSNLIMSRWNERQVCVVASFFNSLNTLAISFSPNIAVWILLYASKGFFFGALLVCPLSLIGFYFKKRRSLASSIVSASSCVAFTAFPPLAIKLRYEYGLRGAMMILAAFELHLVASSMLLRPVSSYKKAFRRKQRMYTTSVTAVKSTSQNGQTTPNCITASHGRGNSTSPVCPDTPTDSSSPIVSSSFLARQWSHVTSASESSEADLTSSDVRFLSPRMRRNDLTKAGDDVILHSSTGQLGREEFPDKPIFVHSPIRGSKTSLRYESTISILSATGSPYLNLPEKQAEEEEDEDTDRKRKEFTCELNSFIDISLFESWMFRMFLLGFTLGVYSVIVQIYMPVIAFSAGVSKADAATLMTISGALDFLSRLLVGYIVDLNVVSKVKLVGITLYMLCALVQFTRFYTTYSLFVMFSVLAGVLCGCRQTLLNVTLIDYVGVEKQAKGFGITQMASTLTLSMTHPIIGALKDATGDFVVPLHYTGFFLFLAGTFLLMEPFFLQLQAKKEKKKEEERKEKDIQKDTEVVAMLEGKKDCT